MWDKWQHIGILGAGESGVGAALLAAKQGMKPFVSDMGRLSDTAREELQSAGISFEEGRHSIAFLKGCDLVIKSPGVPPVAEVVSALREAGTPLMSEIAFAAHFAEAEKIIAITGSNGKTTTTGLTAHILQSAGLRAPAAGNIGRSFARILAEGEEADYYVLELSSFQLENAGGFRPHIAALLNITPDHLDRYQYDLGRYALAKLQITAAQQEGDFFLYWEDDPHTKTFFEAFAKQKTLHAQALPLSLEEDAQENHFRVEEAAYSLSNSGLMGKHNLLNAMFAIRIALLAGLSPNAIQAGLDSFVNVPHRLEKVAEIDDVLFINDSKATNVDAVRYALDAMQRPVVWVAGGTDKGNDYSLLEPLVREKVKALICLGAENGKLMEAFGNVLPNVEEARSTDEAIEKAMRYAAAGDVVLLSPACASFDLFENYEHRGDQFKESVYKLLSLQKR